MKKMLKNYVMLAAALTLVMAMLCGCSNDTTTNADGGNGAGTFTTVTEGKLIMATNAYFPPYEYYEGDAIVGIDAEVAQAIADKLGLELEIQDMEFGSIITAVQMGKVDMGLAGMTVTEERL